MLEGGCLCGAVRYRVDGEPRSVGICHCETCRRTASAPRLPFASVDRVAFAWVKGEPTAFRSSARVTRRFCGRCGSPLTYETTAEADMLDIMVGSLDKPDAVRPTRHVWIAEKIGWDTLAGDLPGHSHGSPSV